jgi:hypothetical protein
MNLDIPGVAPVLAALLPDPIPYPVLVAVLAALGVTPEEFLARCERRAADMGVPTPNLDAVRKAVTK